MTGTVSHDHQNAIALYNEQIITGGNWGTYCDCMFVRKFLKSQGGSFSWANGSFPTCLKCGKYLGELLSNTVYLG